MSEPPQTYGEIVAPMADDLLLPGKMGMGVNLNAAGAERYGELIIRLARIADMQDAQAKSREAGERIFLSAIVGVGFWVVMGMIFNG